MPTAWVTSGRNPQALGERSSRPPRARSRLRKRRSVRRGQQMWQRARHGRVLRKEPDRRCPRRNRRDCRRARCRNASRVDCARRVAPVADDALPACPRAPPAPTGDSASQFRSIRFPQISTNGSSCSTTPTRSRRTIAQRLAALDARAAGRVGRRRSGTRPGGLGSLSARRLRLDLLDHRAGGTVGGAARARAGARTAPLRRRLRPADAPRVRRRSRRHDRRGNVRRLPACELLSRSAHNRQRRPSRREATFGEGLERVAAILSRTEISDMNRADPMRRANIWRQSSASPSLRRSSPSSPHSERYSRITARSARSR